MGSGQKSSNQEVDTRVFQDMSLEEQEDFWVDMIKKSRIKTETKKEESPPFVCRICGCTEYDGVYGDSSMVPLGGRQYPSAYQCRGCSVVFTNIKKFSKI